ncbi:MULTISPECIES: carbohydrate ABC transporter permease [Actinomyces]|uniref:Carbohydrate ABC transporter permease n=1 Tax=Actinomyces respiraculi TaxID=2744574 RepID=A0A7T0LKT2_9ACTO|nr:MULTISPECIES: carbohydrate ABC transporter permease [Actinomyces]QPL05520.1 carbohydrate ABC transporter permease [Actinomyces respiraculi]
MSTTVTLSKPYKDRFWRRTGESDFLKPTAGGAVVRYALLILIALIAVFPFLWQLSTSLKGSMEDIYAFPPNLVPRHPTLEHYATVSHTIPIVKYAWHSLLVGVATVICQVVFCTCAGYALGVLRFRGKALFFGLFLSTLLLPGEVTLTSQYLTVKSLGFANSLVGVFLPGAIGAINVLLITTACAMIPKDIIEAAEIDGATTWQRIRHIVWPNIRGMVTVVALFSFIGAWDDFLWPLVVLSDPEKYTLTVGMQYLQSNFGSNPRVVAAGTIIALVPVIILFALAQKQFFKGVQQGGVKG